MGERDDERPPRVPLVAEVQITLDGVEQLAGLFTDNISEGGVFIRTESPLPAGKKIHLAVSLRSCEAILEADGEVVWTRRSAPGQVGGMGIRFVAVPPAGKELIKDLVEAGDPRPSEALQAYMRAQIAAIPPGTNIPLSICKRDDLLYLCADPAYFYYLGFDGTVYSIDNDDYQLRLGAVRDPNATISHIAQGAKEHPLLRELLPPRPANAPVCDTCKGTGAMDQWGGICKCRGLGWLE